MGSFSWPVRVYYEDTDAGGVVYYANYLRFMERARTEWLRALGFEQDRLRDEGILFAVRTVAIDYLRPARFNQQLDVVSEIDVITRASITFRQRILHGETCLSEAKVKVVCLDAVRFQPRGIPVSMRKGLQHVC